MSRGARAQAPARRLSTKHMLIPKQPPGWNSNPVERTLAVYTPPERRVLNKVAETADIVEVDGKAVYLLIPSTPALLDDLARVGAQFVDLDDIEDLEPANEDGDEKGESSADTEPSLGAPEGQMDQTNLARGNGDDREYDPADEGEPDVDDEPSLGSPDGNIDQTRWACGSYDDREHDPADDRQPDEDYEPDLEGMWERPFV